MARYIDADKIDFRLGVPLEDANGDLYIPLRDVIKAIAQTPTEEVVSKRDCAKDIFEEINVIKKQHASGDIDDFTLYVLLLMLERKHTGS